MSNEEVQSAEYILNSSSLLSGVIREAFMFESWTIGLAKSYKMPLKGKYYVLGECIKYLKTHVSHDTLDILEKAKDSRNELMHNYQDFTFFVFCGIQSPLTQENENAKFDMIYNWLDSIYLNLNNGVIRLLEEHTKKNRATA